MVNDDKFHRLIFLHIFTIIALILVSVLLSNNAYALELHQKTLPEITKNISPEQNPHITVGKGPSDIAGNGFTNTIYVTNYDDNSVSVIDGENNTKIRDIKVGNGPSAISGNALINRMYVINALDNSVSVIKVKNNTKEADIKVGNAPSAIGVNRDSNTVYVTNHDNNSVSVIDGENNTKIGDIKVGNGPSAILVNPTSNTIYVINEDDNSVSVIDGENNTKIGDIKVGNGPSAIVDTYHYVYVMTIYDSVSVIDKENNTKIGDIKVGDGPSAILVNPTSNTIYVTNRNNNSVSVIDVENNTKIGEIKVGNAPSAIGVNRDSNTIYVINAVDNSVSVIDGENNTKIGDIKVGNAPSAMLVNPNSNTIYVTNVDDNSVSVIDGGANKVIAKVIFNTEPFNAGHIECDKDKLIAPVGQQFYIWAGSECTAKPNQGFEFVSWQENLGGNSTQFIQFSSPPSAWDSFLDFLHMKPDKPEATLKITKFGSFTANFKALPPPIPTEYVATLFTVVATAFIGSWLTPTVIEWRNTRKQGSKLDHYHNEIKNLYNDGKLDSNDIEKLNKLRDNITDEYTRGKINKEQYDKLGREISVSYREIFTKEINSLNSASKNDKVKLLYEINDDISDAYAKEKINELHYNLLKEKLKSIEKSEI